MKTLVVGAGALGGIIAARLLASGARVWIATRDAGSAAILKASGLRVSGFGDAVSVQVANVVSTDEIDARERFDLILLATKAGDAIDVAPRLVHLLGPGGTLLPIQNGGVAQLLGERLGVGRVLGGLSNLGATMTASGVYEQRNAGHLLIGELAGGEGARVDRVRRHLGRALEVRVTANLRGAIWSKLLLNCSVTTLGAIAGRTMREYVMSRDGRMLFDQTYDEALSVAVASGARPERMLVDPIPPTCGSVGASKEARDEWIAGILRSYGDVKPSMLQDFERGRATEIDFINGYVVDVGRRLGVATPVNGAIVETVQAISRGECLPDPARLRAVLQAAGIDHSLERE